MQAAWKKPCMPGLLSQHVCCTMQVSMCPVGMYSVHGCSDSATAFVHNTHCHHIKLSPLRSTTAECRDWSAFETQQTRPCIKCPCIKSLLYLAALGCGRLCTPLCPPPHSQARLGWPACTASHLKKSVQQWFRVPQLTGLDLLR